jgi:iron complex outermembrane receptor protein
MGECGLQIGAGLNWSVTLHIKNVTDERYFVAANGTGGYVGNPLTACVTAHFNC